jgi:hypothetical protein
MPSDAGIAFFGDSSHVDRVVCVFNDVGSGFLKGLDVSSNLLYGLLVSGLRVVFDKGFDKGEGVSGFWVHGGLLENEAPGVLNCIHFLRYCGATDTHLTSDFSKALSGAQEADN